MKKILTVLAVLIITQIACLQTTIRVPTAPPAPDTALPITGSQPPEPTEEENAAGAVYEIPTPAPLSTGLLRLCAIVTADEALHLRATPREGAPFLAYLMNGEQVRVINPNGAWWRVTNSRGETGYANSRYLQEAKCES